MKHLSKNLNSNTLEQINDSEASLRQTIEQLGVNISHGLFATPATLPSAIKRAYDIIENLEDSDKSAGYTALHIVMNAIGNELKRIAKNS